jgi:predicted phage terminase large subunit-like protein
MLKGTQVLWPEVEPYPNLMKQMVSGGRRAFFSEKQNEPYDPSTQIFNLDLAHYFEYHPKDRLLVCRNRKHQVLLSELHTVVAFHDPCLGESDTGDYAAIVVVGKDHSGYMYVLDAFIERCKPDRQISAAIELYDRWQFDKLVLEGNQFQRVLLDSYNQRFSTYADPPRIQKMVQTGDKELRISNLQPLLENGRLIFNKQLDSKLFEQLKYFPSATYDDGPDALEGAISLLVSRQSQPTGERRNVARRNPIRR